MKQLWHSRSIAVAKYPSNILKQVNEYDSKKVEEEESKNKNNINENDKIEENKDKEIIQEKLEDKNNK